MKILLLVFFLIFNYTIDAQIEIERISWKNFTEPDGKFSYILLNPAASIWDSPSLRFDSKYIRRGLNDLSINYFDIELDFDNYKNNDDETFNSITLNPIVELTKYIKKRRGVFAETKTDIKIIRQFELIPNYDFETSTSLSLGIGRVEVISTLNQSLRIFKNIQQIRKNINIITEQEVSELAKLLRELDYDFARDQRIQSINRIDKFLEYFISNGINLNNTNLTSQLIDGYLFSRFRNQFDRNIGSIFRDITNPFSLKVQFDEIPGDPIGENSFGQKITFSIEHQSDINNNDQKIYQYKLNFEFMKSISFSNYIRLNAYGLINYYLYSEISHLYRTGISSYYTPNARTNFNVSFIYRYGQDSNEKIDAFTIGIGSTYFINYNSIISLSFSYCPHGSYKFLGNTFETKFTQYIY